ncbi:MAG: DUF1588 domain-containing protein [Akkermansiaceae bacterium]
MSEAEIAAVSENQYLKGDSARFRNSHRLNRVKALNLRPSSVFLSMFPRYRSNYGLALALPLLISSIATARTWTNAAGTSTFEAELVAYEKESGTVKVLIDGVSATLQQSMLSAADIAFLKKQEGSREITVPVSVKADSTPASEMPKEIEFLLEDHCWKCHDYGTQKGDIRLDHLGELETSKRLDLLNRMQEQVYFKHMPPKKEEQPSEADRKALLAYISAELAEHKASTLEGKLQKPEYGNYIDHEKLFSGEFKDVPAYTTDRRWLISEFIFNAKFQRILMSKTTMGYKSKRYTVLGSKRFERLGLANPFLLPKTIGVRYYANEDLTGGHLSSMLTTSQEVSREITEYLVPRHSKGREPYLPAIAEILAMEEAHKASLASRREFMGNHIERICREVHGDKHESFLPSFVPVKLNPLKQLEKGEKYKRAPHVAIGMLGKLEGDQTVFRYLYQPEYANLSDDEFRDLCERTWFYAGDHERTIQARMGILREYMVEIREATEGKKRKIKPLEYEPLADEDMEAIYAAILKFRKEGDFYSDIIEKCIADWEKSFAQQRVDAGPPTDDIFLQLIHELSTLMLERPPTADEAADYLGLIKSYTNKLGRRKAVQKLTQTFLLSSEFAYRSEFGVGEPDEHGRLMMSPRDASYAISYALTDQSPDAELVAAAKEGRLNTRADYEREVKRLLSSRNLRTIIDPVLEDKRYGNNSTDMPIRELRFFREFFGYPKALEIFKDEKRFGGDRLANATNRLVNEADRLVEYILEKDQDVFGELVGTDKFYVYHDGDNERMLGLSDHIKEIYDYFKEKDWQNFEKEDLEKHAEFMNKIKMRHVNVADLSKRYGSGSSMSHFKRSMASITARLDKGQEHAAPFDLSRGYGSQFMSGGNVARFWGIPRDNWHWSPEQPMKIANRKGLLTHPAWLVAHAFNTETDPVHRGKFVREKLLADTIPDVPITVDAQIPEDHNKTLRQRLTMATETKSCWHCHEKMNPLGNTFEMYDDFGRIRVEEALEYPEHLIEKKREKPHGHHHMEDIRDIFKTLPVDATGYLEGSGDPSLDGDLKGAVDLADRLSKSRRVRQSFIRHAFRYFMGRNEFLSDSKTLIDAEKAYDTSGGSFDAVVVSLLTSDSFIYRKPIE